MIIRCIHTDYDICYCGCAECSVRCTIAKQKLKQETDFKLGEPEYLENNPEYQGDLIDQAEYARGDR